MRATSKTTIRVLLYLLATAVCLVISGNAVMASQADRDYVIGPGDMLSIQVWGEADLTRTVEVSREGAFTFPLIGKVDADGLTVFDLEKRLTQRLSDGYLIQPQITVSVSEYRHQKVFLFGKVKKPGTHIIRGKTHLLELISEVGGFTDDAGSTATIVRPKNARQKERPLPIESAQANEIISVDLDRLTAGSPDETAYAVPGDSIYILEAKPFFVTGEVRKPGQFKWEKNLSVRQAISYAGGPSSVGAPDRVRIVRMENGKENEFKPSLSDPVLPNDIIKVPKSFF